MITDTHWPFATQRTLLPAASETQRPAGAALPTESLRSRGRGNDVYVVLPEASFPSSLAPRGLSKAPISETHPSWCGGRGKTRRGGDDSRRVTGSSVVTHGTERWDVGGGCARLGEHCSGKEAWKRVLCTAVRGLCGSCGPWGSGTEGGTRQLGVCLPEGHGWRKEGVQETKRMGALADPVMGRRNEDAGRPVAPCRKGL